MFEKVFIDSCTLDTSIVAEFNSNKWQSAAAPPPTERAFFKVFRTEGVYSAPQVKVHPMLHTLFSSSLIFDSNRMPMLVPPMPWHTHTHGGYFLSSSSLLRLSKDHIHEQLVMLDKAHPSAVHPVYDSLNTLSHCPWRINTVILDKLIEVFNAGGSKELGIPEDVSKMSGVLKTT